MISLGSLGAPAEIAHRFGTWLRFPIASFQKKFLLVAPLSLRVWARLSLARLTLGGGGSR